MEFGTLQKKQREIRMQLKKNPELNSKGGGPLRGRSCRNFKLVKFPLRPDYAR
jgi:hypothetical protein